MEETRYMSAQEYKNLSSVSVDRRIYHDCEGGIEKSIMTVKVG